MASTIKVDTVTTPDGTGNITISRPIVADGTNLTNLPAANLTGTLPAISGASLTNLPIDPSRNFIIDGDFTQWPQGTVTIPTTAYGPALWEGARGTSLVYDMVEETSVLPTVAQSGHQSSSCFKLDVTTADASIAATDQQRLQYKMTGKDFQALHQQQVTFCFWVRSTITGTFTVSFQNSALDRSYVAPYTISSSDTWEKKEITLTLDTSGTWLFTEAGVGLRIIFCFMAGTDLHASASTWSAGEKYGVAGMANGVNSTSNNIYISQVGLYKGSSAPSSFVGESIATVKKQVAYYFQNEAEANSAYKWAGHGGVTSSSTLACKIRYSGGPMRAIPTITSSAAGTWTASDHTTGGNVTVISFSGTDTDRTLANITYSGGWTLGRYGYFYRNNTSTTYLYLDARH